eukprot:TRINITY_DN3393_c0_g2_i1.p1 TRINITY_DN3393_c0_g2~~TRINITY_DN3393_c0_g2_i1.p1  ORF type:complete len:880 (+),score=333.03 TRINITY_DN3393_c0_g2_i1:133-2772(+)
MKVDLRKEKERLSKFEKNSSDLWKSIDKFLETSKAQLSATEVLLSDLQKFYSEEEGNDVIVGSTSILASEFCKKTRQVQSQSRSMLETIKTTLPGVQSQYQQIHNSFKKRIHEVSNLSEQERENLQEDLSVFEEQKQELFDPILLILVKFEQLHSEVSASSSLSEEIPASTVYQMNSLVSLLLNPQGKNYFRTFLLKERSVENVDFYSATDQYSTITSQDAAAKKAREIIELYLLPGCDKEVNISGPLIKKIQENLSNPKSDLFEEAQRAVIELMLRDSFPRFQRDHLFSRLQRKLKRREFNAPKASSNSTTRGRSPSISRRTKDDAMTERDWNLLLSGAETINYRNGDVIEGPNANSRESSLHFFKIVIGKVKMVTREGQLIRTLVEGDVFDVMPLLDFASVHDFIADAHLVQVSRIQSNVMQTLLQVDSGLSERFFTTMCGRLSHYHRQLPLESALRMSEQSGMPIELGVKSRRQTMVPDENPPPMNESDDYRIKGLLRGRSDVVFKEFEGSHVTKLKVFKGTFFLFSKHVGFYSKVFGNVTRVLEKVEDITSEELKEEKLILRTNKKKYVFAFENTAVSEEVSNAISVLRKLKVDSFMVPMTPRTKSTEDLKRVESRNGEDSDEEEEERDIWDEISYFSTVKTYSKGEYIITSEYKNRAIHQIISGSCVSVLPTGVEVDELGPDQIFGEVSYIVGGSEIEVYAAMNDTKVITIDRSSLSELLTRKPQIAMIFNQFLAHQIANRLVPSNQRLSRLDNPTAGKTNWKDEKGGDRRRNSVREIVKRLSNMQSTSSSSLPSFISITTSPLFLTLKSNQIKFESIILTLISGSSIEGIFVNDDVQCMQFKLEKLFPKSKIGFCQSFNKKDEKNAFKSTINW